MKVTPTPTAQAVDRAIENCPELNMSNYDEVDVERLNDWAIRAHGEIDRLHALAAGQATAAQAAVQDDLITIRKPTTSAEMLWLLKLAHLVISDVGKTLEETFAPAQPVAQASRFGSPELQAMIVARCVEKDRADSVQEDAARLDYLHSTGSTIEMLPGEVDSYPMRFRVGGLHSAVSPNLRDAIDIARKQGASHD